MPKGTSNPRGRRPYATQACTICRAKKSKCDGVKPVCSSCAASGRDNECLWGRDTTARKPRTEAHFEALRKRTDSLQAYSDLLDGMISKCVCQDVSSHLSSRPRLAGETADEESDTNAYVSDDEEITQELTVPLQRLKLDSSFGGGLLLNGITAPFRHAKPILPSRPIPSVPVNNNLNLSYVLLVDGVEEVDAHPDIDWSRYLPPEVPLDRREHDKILDLSFKFWTGWCLRLPPTLFFRDMYRALSVPRSQRPPKTPSYSPMLHNATLAICAIFSSDSHIRDLKTRQYFADAAKKYLEAECQKPEISLMHSLAFLGTFYANAGDRILGDLYAGMSSRMCVALGLGFDSTEWFKSGLIANEEMIGRGWAYWTIFCVDVCWALFFGRDFCGPPAEGRRPIALPSVDTEADQIPWFHAPSNIPPQPNLFTLTFYEAAALFAIGRKIIDIVNGLDRTQQDAVKVDQLVTKIDLELNNWKSELPPELDITLATRGKSTPHRLMLHCEYWWCFIVLHRPFFSRKAQAIQNSDRDIDHVKLCKRAAESILELSETWSTLYTLRYANVTMLQVLFSAGTVFVLLALQATASARIAHATLQTSLQQCEQCIRYLHEMGTTWASAMRTGDALRAILQDKLHPIITRRLAHKGMRLPVSMATTTTLTTPAAPMAPGPSQTSTLQPQHSTSTPPEALTPVHLSVLLPDAQGLDVSHRASAFKDETVVHGLDSDLWPQEHLFYSAPPAHMPPPMFIDENALPDVDIAAFLPNFDMGWYDPSRM